MRKQIDELILEYHALSRQEISQFYSSLGKYGRAFLINMKDKTQRLAEATETLDKVSIPFTRFVALNGKEILASRHSAIARNFSILRPGELGCLLSHLAIINLCAKHPNQQGYTLIFEDDIITSSGSSAMEKSLSDIAEIDRRENIGIVYLGKCSETCAKMIRVKDNIWRGVAPLCCHAYMMKHEFAKQVIENMERCTSNGVGMLNCGYYNRAIDGILRDYTANGIVNCLVFHPSIFYQNVLTNDSDLRSNCLINYQECGDLEQNKHMMDHYKNKIMAIFGNPTTIILGAGILLILMYCWSSKIRNMKLYLKWIALATIVIALAYYVFRMTRGVLEAPPLTEFLETVKEFPKEFEINETSLATKEYVVFNPNAIVIGDKIAMAARASNGKMSYPIFQLLSKDMKVLESKRLMINESLPEVKQDTRGHEDARIFQYKGEIYLIGTNLDRNPKGLPSMVLIPFATLIPIHLHYAPVANNQNKNWAPIELPSEELGFVVNLDPLLVVKQIKSDQGECSLVCEGKREFPELVLRNSSITYALNIIPSEFASIFLKMGRVSIENDGDDIDKIANKYVMLAHSKYIESDYVANTTLVIYQHYFVVIDLDKKSKKISRPFHVEKRINPHIEYVSGFFFHEGRLVITYGLDDKKSKYLILNTQEVKKLVLR